MPAAGEAPGADGRDLGRHILMRAFVDELVRCGLRQVATSPGSRSTPLLLALVRDGRLRVSSQLDERDGGFFALGAAKASGRPAAVCCTSGTAAANYLPAVVEAREARVPLLVFTADRPPELREVGAGQAIDQLKLYGGYARWFFDLDDAPYTPERLRFVRQLACRAYWTALDGPRGPVHLNVPFREPLAPGGPPPGDPSDGARAGGRPWVTRPAPPASAAPATVKALTEELKARPRTVIVAGRQERDAALPTTLAALAERLAAPLLADALSGARRGEAAIAHYDLILRDYRPAPELVLRVGDLPTSKPLRRWLAAHAESAVQVVLDPDAAWQDPDGAAATVLRDDPQALVQALDDALRRRRDRAWLEQWHAADRRAARAIAETLAPAGLSEPRVAAELGVRLPPQATLVVGSSMPVRDVETFFPARAQPPRVLANRGANGIDGTLATALGVAAASAGPVVALCGDLTLLHNVGALAGAREHRLIVICLDNDGGGIFHFLPVAGEGEAFERFVATPHGLDLTHVAALFELELHRPQSPESFRDALDAALQHDGSSLLLVRTDRLANRELHAAVASAVATSLAGHG